MSPHAKCQTQPPMRRALYAPSKQCKESPIRKRGILKKVNRSRIIVLTTDRFDGEDWWWLTPERVCSTIVYCLVEVGGMSLSRSLRLRLERERGRSSSVIWTWFVGKVGVLIVQPWSFVGLGFRSVCVVRWVGIMPNKGKKRVVQDSWSKKVFK